MLCFQGYFFFSRLTSCRKCSCLFTRSGWTTGCAVDQLSVLSRCESNHSYLQNPFYSNLSPVEAINHQQSAATELREGQRGSKHLADNGIYLSPEASCQHTCICTRRTYGHRHIKAWLLSLNASHTDISTKHPGRSEGSCGRRPCHV